MLHGSLGDEDLLMEEHIEDIDFFLALGDDDENNIMASLLAKRLGARRVLALINQRSYAAHTRKAGMTEIGKFDFGGGRYWMMAVRTRPENV